MTIRDRMDSSHGPDVLQLLKWGPTGFRHNLSDYREAFISPTREQLLLLSYQYEALLLPLVTGDFPSQNVSQGLQNQSSETSSSAASRRSNTLGSKDGSSTGADSDSVFSSVQKIPSSSKYSFISGANSLAWGLCGDSYNSQNGTSFKELLFVSNGHQVVVHAFRRTDRTVDDEMSVLGNQFGQGRWVKWGPNLDMEPDDSFSPSSEITDTNAAANNVHQNGDGVKGLQNDRVIKDLSGGVDSKKWFCSFSTKAETVESDGKFWTQFPGKASFPSSAEVVSFSLFDNGSPLRDFVTHGISSGSIVNKSDSLSYNVGDSCKCSRVFSNCSYSLVGFVLSLVDSVFTDPGDDIRKTRTQVLLVVGRIQDEGIQWVSSVKLKDSFDAEPLAEWVDFCFSDNLLVCLSTRGLVYFYAAFSGEFVAHIDILQASGPNPQPSILGKDGVHLAGGRRKFKKLLGASHTTLIAAVDEHGVVYVISVGKHLPAQYKPRDRLLPTSRNSELGMFVGWEVGSKDIGCQRVYLTSSSREVDKPLSFSDSKHAQLNSSGRAMQKDLHYHGFGAASKMCLSVGDVGETSHLIRDVLLPTERFGEDDSICFSAMGITRFLRRRSLDSQRSNQVFHLGLRKHAKSCDDESLNPKTKLSYHEEKVEVFLGETVGCSFQGSLYLVTEVGISVVLPSVSVSANYLPVETLGYRQHKVKSDCRWNVHGILCDYGPTPAFFPWKVEILDRVILLEGPEVADRLCLQNGWDMKISRLRRLQLALDYLKFNEIQLSLEMLMDVNLAEEGILRLLFAAVYLMSLGNGNDIEVSAASRLLVLATSFTTKIIRNDGLLEHKGRLYSSESSKMTRLLSLPSVHPEDVNNETDNSQRLYDMGHFLEIVRNLQYRLGAMSKQTGQGSVDGRDALSLAEVNAYPDQPQLALTLPHAASLETLNHHELQISEAVSSSDKLALVPTDSVDNRFDAEDSNTGSMVVSDVRHKVLPLENPMEMIARWKLDNLDLKTVVKDALHAGRLPLAVLQLHLHRSKEMGSDKEPPDTFGEVREIGRAIAYDLFLKGETKLAIATLQRLGEEVENCLKQLLFGTVRRSLRVQVAEEMRRYRYLGTYEWKILEKISLIERLYPSSSFWRTFLGRQNASTNGLDSPIRLHLLNSLPYSEAVVECGEIDGVVLGSWTTISENTPDPEVGEDEGQAGYWAAAVVWSGAWDQRTIDRIVLDQPFLMGVHVLWESQFEYYASHNDWDEISKLVDIIPSSVLANGSLQISLDSSQQTPAVGYGSEFSDYGNYISIEELDAVCLDIPGIKIFRFPVSAICSTWLRRLIEQELAKKHIFLKEYWEGTAEIVGLLARTGFISRSENILVDDDNDEGLTDLNISVGRPSIGTMQGLLKLVIHHCVQYNLPNLLDLYLDRHRMALDNNSLSSLVEAAGDCQWAKWLILSRIKGREYDSSFCNARTVLSRNLSSDGNPMEINDIIHTVDDIAEGGGEMAALATLMYSPIPIQNCLCSGSVIRHGSSAQCTMENLRPTLQQFPTLQRSLLASSFEQDKTSNFLGLNANNVLSSYLKWRDNIFFSSGRDTSLLQMLPCWFPKSVRRLIQLYIQGPLGWQSLLGTPPGDSLYQRDIDFYILEEEHTDISPLAWEATVQKHVQEELYGSLLEETGLGLEHHLLRGRALAAFNHVLGVRLQKLKQEGESEGSSHRQNNIQSDVQILLAPLVPSEEVLLSSVIPLAITHFEDSVLVASCTFLLELCGLSASMIRVDVACLSRISSFYKLRHETYGQISPKGSAFHPVSYEDERVESLARSLADEYVNRDYVRADKLKQSPQSITGKRPSRALMLVLHHLEKASLPTITDAKTCGSWLLTGNGDGTELRSQQKAASQHWNLVTVFCQMHQLPLSMKYLAFLARDNDWVGFLSEAQIGGYSFDTVLQVASKEFSDARLKIHVMTVLKSMQSKKKIGSSSSDTAERSLPCSDDNVLIPVELFSVLADCEQQNSPGVALLRKAKEMSWATLAMVASCFPEVSPLTCLTVWLEITAARETSSIKVNNVTSQIADNVLAAVEATNSLPTGTASPTCHYNRQNPKRRRIMEPISENKSLETSRVSGISNSTDKYTSEDAIAEEIKAEFGERHTVSGDSDEGQVSLSKMVAVLCEQKLFLPLLRAFEMFLPSCSLLPFLRALQAFSQMRLSEASAHLGSFSARIRDEASSSQTNVGREASVGVQWISSTAVRAADAMLSTCPSAYEKRCLLQLLAATEFGDGGSAATYYRQLYWKINLAEPSLRKGDDVNLGDESLDDASLLEALEKNGYWEQARNWARQLGASGGTWKSAVHHVTETQAESMVAEWKEFLWDVPEERVALWGHCQTLFIRYSFPPLQAGLFFLKHAEAVEKDLPAKELHELLLLSLQWLSGMITLSNPVYPLHLLREIETRVWLLAVESEAQIKCDGDFGSTASSRDPVAGHPSNMIDKTASLVAKMDRHINAMKSKSVEIHESRENNILHHRNQVAADASTSANTKTKRRTKGHFQPRKPYADPMDKASADSDEIFASHAFRNDLQFLDESAKLEVSFSKWEERIETAEMERAVLSLLEFGQITAAKQLQHKLSPSDTPSEFILVDAALTIATISTPWSKVSVSMLNEDVLAVLQSYNICTEENIIDPLEVLESLVAIFTESRGRGLCKRIIAVVKAANVLGLSFSEAFDKQPVELLQLLSLKAQESFEEALLLVQTHTMTASSIAQILAESFLKGLLAAHRGGYIDSQKDEGPAPLLWRFSDFLKWAQLCPSEPEIGHALMRLVITGQEIPHACEVELLILSHHFYKSSACLDGVDVLVALAATRVDAYVSEGDYSCLARLLTGVGNFQALYFVLGILIENGQLDLLLQKFTAAADSDTETAVTVEGFRMAVLTALKHFNPQDLDAFDMVYNHFNMKHDIGALLESRARACSEQWFRRYYKDQNEELLEAMRYSIEAAEVYFSMDAGNKTRRACSEASLVSLQIRMPDTKWLSLSETNARRILVEQSQFQEALIVAEAYGLNQPGEWVLVLWNQMLKPELTEAFVAEFVAVLPLQPSTLIELARFYRAEVAARGDQSQFSVWLTGGGMPAEWAKYLGRSFRCLLKVTWDLRLRLQLANIATGFGDIVDSCMKALDKVPENGGPLVLRKGHGGGYLPLM